MSGDNGTKPYWVTKYALSDGIRKVDLTVRSGGEYAHNRQFQSFKVGKDFFESLDDALSRAEAMKEEKIASLEKQIAKIKKMDMAKRVKGEWPFDRGDTGAK